MNKELQDEFQALQVAKARNLRQKRKLDADILIDEAYANDLVELAGMAKTREADAMNDILATVLPAKIDDGKHHKKAGKTKSNKNKNKKTKSKKLDNKVKKIGFKSVKEKK